MPAKKGTSLAGISDAQWQWILDRYNEGYTIRQLANFCYVHRMTIRRHLEAMGARLEGRPSYEGLSARRAEFDALK